MLFFRVYQHLLPRAVAWQLTITKSLRQYWLGLSHAPQEVRDFFDRVYQDQFPETTTSLAEWEAEFGLPTASSDSARRLQLAAHWSAEGGQSPSYLEGVVRAAGFDVRLYEWWTNSNGPPWTARDPREYTHQPQIGTVQCGVITDPTRQCTLPSADPPDPLPVGIEHPWELYPQCNRFLQNNTQYLVNDNLTPNAPPPVPDDAATWPYFVYWAGATIDTKAEIPEERRAEFERLLLKICPEHCWIVTYVDYV